MRLRPKPWHPDMDPKERIHPIVKHVRNIIGELILQYWPEATHFRFLNKDSAFVGGVEGETDLVVTRHHIQVLQGIPGMFAFDILGDFTIEKQSETKVHIGAIDSTSWDTVIPTPEMWSH